MWKAPNRPKHEITQSYNDGITTVYKMKNKAESGYKPDYELIFNCVLRFDEQRLGLNRLYLSRQNQVEIERVIRVQKVENISTQDVVVIKGKQYRIDTIQSVKEIYPPSLDLALTKIEQQYEVIS